MAKKKLRLDNLSAEELRDLASPVTKDEAGDCNAAFTPYIFYRTLKDGQRECFCSACNKHYFVNYGRTIEEKTVRFMSKKHNEDERCPECSNYCTMKNIGKIRNAGNLYEEQRLVMIEVINKNAVLLKCYYGTKEYSADAFYSPKYGGYIYPEDYSSEAKRFLKNPRMQLSKVYLLQPGLVQSARLDGYMWGQGSGWNIKTTHREPFVAWFGGNTDYWVVNFEALEKTFLKYAPFDKWNQINNNYLSGDGYFVTYLCRSAELPALEVLTKLGFKEPVNDLIYRDRYNKRMIDWNALKPWDIFKMHKAEYKELEKYNDRFPSSVLYLLKVYKDLSCFKITGGMKKAIEIFDLCGKSMWVYDDRLKPILKTGCSFTKIKNYIEKNWKDGQLSYEVLGTYSDYIRMAKELEYDLQNEVVLFPKNLKKAHDTADENLTIVRAQARAKKYEEKENKAQKTIKKFKKQYEFVGEKYSVLVPEKALDIIREGQLMHHCVGGYVDRHFDGSLCICFLRKNDDIETPLYTIEMRGKEVGQIQRKGNAFPTFRPQDSEVKEFFNNWKKWVKEGSKSVNKKEKAVTAA